MFKIAKIFLNFLTYKKFNLIIYSFSTTEYEHISKESFENFLKEIYSFMICFEDGVNKACSLTDLMYTAKVKIKNLSNKI